MPFGEGGGLDSRQGKERERERWPLRLGGGGTGSAKLQCDRGGFSVSLSS